MILLVLIALAPVFAVVVQASLAEQRVNLRSAESNLQSLVELGAAHQERLVDGARQVLTAIANAPPVYGDDPLACASYFSKLQAQYAPLYGTFGLLDPQGYLTCRAVAPPTPVRSNDRLFFRTAVETGRFSVGEFAVSRASGRQVLTFGLPVYREGRQLRGVAYLALDVRQSAEQLRSLGIGADTTLLVADGGGLVLAAAGPAAIPSGQTLPLGFLAQAVRAARPVLGTGTDVSGREWLYAVRPVGRAGENKLFVAGMVSSEAVLAPSRQRLWSQLAALAAITVAGMGLAWAFAGRVVLGPMRRLLEQVEALAQQEVRLDAALPRTTVREFGELHERFHAMARRLAEREIQRDGAMVEMEHQKNLVEAVLSGMAEAVLVLDRQGRLLHVNAAGRMMLPALPASGPGRSAGAVLPDHWEVYEPDGRTPCLPAQRPGSRALHGEVIEHYRYLLRGALTGGRELVIQGSARPMRLPGDAGRGAVLVFSDITQAWRAEQALRASEQRYRSLFESNPHPMWMFDVQTLRFLAVNDAAVAHYGYSRDEFLAMTIADIRPEQDVESLRRLLQGIPGTNATPAVWRHKLKDGRLIHVEVTSHALDYEGRPARVVLAHDITQRLLAQEALHRLNETLERRVEERTHALALANQELESFSYSVSHDLRAPLQVIDGFGQALVMHHAQKLDGQARHYLERIRENTRQMGQLIDDLLSLARVTRTELACEHFDLAERVAQVVERLLQREPDRVVQVRIDRPMPCYGDPRLLTVALENLLGNAWKFTGRTPVAQIHVGCVAVGDGHPAFFVADNGAGFDMAYANKLFRAFHRLHAATEFEGTGIGLATVHRIVTRHGGKVWAESQPGQGATFHFTLRGIP